MIQLRLASIRKKMADATRQFFLLEQEEFSRGFLARGDWRETAQRRSQRKMPRRRPEMYLNQN
jgi:hypothetical protein